MDEETKELKIYDPPMCCPTGICGPNVDRALVEFAGAVKRLAGYGIPVERWNLAQQPKAFIENPLVRDLLAKLGVKGLPFILVNDEIKLSGRYPTAEELFTWFGIGKEEIQEKKPVQADSANEPFPMLERDDVTQSVAGCCGEEGCCS